MEPEKKAEERLLHDIIDQLRKDTSRCWAVKDMMDAKVTSNRQKQMNRSIKLVEGSSASNWLPHDLVLEGPASAQGWMQPT